MMPSIVSIMAVWNSAKRNKEAMDKAALATMPKFEPAPVNKIEEREFNMTTKPTENEMLWAENNTLREIIKLRESQILTMSNNCNSLLDTIAAYREIVNEYEKAEQDRKVKLAIEEIQKEINNGFNKIQN